MTTLHEQHVFDVMQTLRVHRPRQVSVSMGVTCACGYWTGSERQPPRVTGDDGLDYHRARVLTEMLVKAWQSGLEVGMDDDRATNEENPYG